MQVPVDGGGGEVEASKQPPPLHGIICLRRFCTTLSWPRRGCPAVLNCVKPRGGGPFCGVVLNRVASRRAGHMSRASVGLCRECQLE